jgi:N-carbamoylputrescine amidase
VLFQEVIVGRTVNVALIQMSCGGHVEANLKNAVEYIERAASQGANIVCTQELFKSRYFPQVVESQMFNLAESIDENSSTLQDLCQLARDFEIVLVASVFEKRALGLYHNTAVVIDADGRFLGKYRKMHIPDDPLYYEKFYFAPGDLGYQVFRTRYADIGVLLCWDQWFPEAARLTAMKGAAIIFVPTAIGYSRPERQEEGAAYRDAWQIVQRGHAVANACYLACVNRVGFEENPEGKGGIDFWGTSFVAGPYGQLLGQASENDEEILLCAVDLSQVAAVRDSFSFPFRDRRIDSYSDITKRYLDAGG